jgi:hypothetical protein
MGIVKYKGGGLNRTFNIGQALKDGWGLEWKGEGALVGIKLQDRTNPTHKVEITKTKWMYGTFIVFFGEGDWLCFDHAINQFKIHKQ